MEKETVKQENTVTNDEVKERMFTQSELDAIVGERLSREREKYNGFEELKAKAEKYDEQVEASKTELQKAIESRDSLQKEVDRLTKEREVASIRLAVSEDTGVPISLLTGETEDECKAQADAIKAYANPQGYPNVRDAGEHAKVGKMTTKQQFAEWANKAFNN